MTGKWLSGLLLITLPALLSAQKHLIQFRVSDNLMRIVLSRDVPINSVDSFLIKTNLKDIGLHSLMSSGKDDSLILAGWMIDRKDPQRYSISKPLQSGDPGATKKIIFTPVPTPEDWRIIGGNKVVYGANSFRDGNGFKKENGITIFRLNGFQQAKKVRLAGNFTNWQHGAFPMERSGGGWTVPVNLPPGQYFYKFIVNDDDWMTDPANELSENDGKGNENSVYYVTNRNFHLNNHLEAKQVSLTGNFSNWAGSRLPLHRAGNGWDIDMYLQPGTWTYSFIVDGKAVRNDGDPVTSVGEPYLFILPGHERAHKVVLAGEFNDWKENELHMNKTSRGWELPYVLGPGNYQYKFIVDGQWITDPGNPSYIDDGKGNTNSFLVIGANYTFRLKGYENARKVALAGDFNSWSPEGLSMEFQGKEWVRKIYLAKGKHLYKFFVDGQWILDPKK